MPTPYSPGGGKVTPCGHLFAVQRVGHLDQDAGAVAHQLVGTHRARWSRFSRIFSACSRCRGASALDVGHKADAAGVVF
jgi:hypothetical protein